MSRKILTISAFSLVVLSGVVHGLWTDRWSLSDEPGASAARLESLPLTLGEWEGEPADLDVRQLDDIAGFIHRRYVHRPSGTGVAVFLVCGRPGPVSIHTPDVCYGASGFRVESPVKQPLSFGEKTAELWMAHVHKTKAADKTQVRIFWSWYDGAAWTASANPRADFARKPVLFKLYVLRAVVSLNEPLEHEPCLDLMRSLLPAFQRSVSPAG